MRMIDIIEKKRDGNELTKEEISFFVKGASNDSLPDYQISALLMAIYINGMTDYELEILTSEMAESGEVKRWDNVDGLTCDKHSTGGVGDKTSLIVVPIAASLGVKVVKMSGKGLGHTGGTVDKLEAIKGFCTVLTPDKLTENVKKVGAVMIGQSGNLAPADKRLYAIRDVTGTVSSIPLIASSIMSKKIASGSKCIVLDVKCGSGAFMKTPERAYELAEKMVEIGRRKNRKMSAVVTDMDIPLGYAIGNSLEVIEAVNVLKGGQKGDLYDICIELAAHMLMLSLGLPLEECRKKAVMAVESGSAYEKLKEIVSAQGGDVSYLEDTEMFERSENVYEIRAKQSGYIGYMNCEGIGNTSVILGAGRSKKDQAIDHSAGIILCKKTGDEVTEGEVIAKLYTNQADNIALAAELFESSMDITNTRPEKKPLIYSVIE